MNKFCFLLLMTIAEVRQETVDLATMLIGPKQSTLVLL
ncbi:hypothetical protein GFK82_00094 [Candidatus Steffania adelgidicola]|nr:hypothetical protein GFK82_00094 [Candidatus Steffania adelgidicola]